MNRVSKMEYPHGWVEDYEYDSIGQLLKVTDTDPSNKDMKKQKHAYTYDNCGNMLYEYMRGNGTGTYTYNDRLSVDVKGIESGAGNIIENGDHIRLCYHMDYLGTADYLTSPVSLKVESWIHYNEWGEISHNAVLKCGQRELDLVKRYATHDYDSVLNMYYAKARFYDAGDRRFTAIDPILDASKYDIKDYVKNPVELVQYLYVQNNPVIYIDIDGLQYVEDDTDLAGAYKDYYEKNTQAITNSPETLVKQQGNSKDKNLEKMRVFISGQGWKTVEELAGEEVRWASWEDILYANILKRIEKMPYIPDDTARITEIDNIIYEEAEKLQSEFGVLYHPTGSIFSPSHIIHTTLDDLYTQYNRPKEKSLVSIFAEGFSTGFKTGLWLTALQNSGYHKGPGCVDAAASQGKTVRETLLESASNQKLKNTIDQIYRPGATTGDGGLADAIRHQLSTGELVGGKDHLMKGVQRVRNLENIIKNQDLSSNDLELALKLLNDLINALGGN